MYPVTYSPYLSSKIVHVGGIILAVWFVYIIVITNYIIYSPDYRNIIAFITWIRLRKHRSIFKITLEYTFSQPYTHFLYMDITSVRPI
jgi:hypothetical protein